MKYKEVLANQVVFELVDFKEIKLLISALENKIIRKLSINLESKSGDKIFIAIEQFWQGDLTLWAKINFKAEAEVFFVHMAAQLAKLYRDTILSKLDLDMQNVVKTVQQRVGVLLYLEEVEIEDANKGQLDQLIDIEELKTMEGEDRSVVFDNTSVVSFSEQSFFSVNSKYQNKENNQQEYFAIMKL